MNKPVLLNFFAFSLDLIYFETMIFFLKRVIEIFIQILIFDFYSFI